MESAATILGPTRAEQRAPFVRLCRACGSISWSGPMCSRCGGALEDSVISPAGEVVAVTTVTRVPDDVLIAVPYSVALVRLGKGQEALCIADPTDVLRIGDVVALDLDAVEQAGGTVVFPRVRRESGSVRQRP